MWLSRNKSDIHEDASSIPGLAQWVKDLVVPQAVVQITDMGWNLHCCGCGVGQQLWLWGQIGTSICHECGPKNSKKKQTAFRYIFFEIKVSLHLRLNQRNIWTNSLYFYHSCSIFPYRFMLHLDLVSNGMFLIAYDSSYF